MPLPRLLLLPCLLLATLPASTLAASTPTAAPAPLRLVANYWEPYTGENLPAQGLASELVSTALARAGYESRIAIMPWPRALAMAYQGGADGVVAIWATQERRDKLQLSEAYYSNRMVFLHLKGAAVATGSLDELKGLHIGVGRGYEYSDNFKSQAGLLLEPTDSVLQNLRKLAAKRLDLVLEDRQIAQYNLGLYSAQLPELGTIEVGDKAFFTLPLYFGVSRKRPDAAQLIARFNASLAAMKADGSYERIIKKHSH